MSTPTKQQVREWLYGQVQAKTPPPTPEEVRRQLGWDLLKSKPRN